MVRLSSTEKSTPWVCAPSRSVVSKRKTRSRVIGDYPPSVASRHPRSSPGQALHPQGGKEGIVLGEVRFEFHPPVFGTGTPPTVSPGKTPGSTPPPRTGEERKC